MLLLVPHLSNCCSFQLSFISCFGFMSEFELMRDAGSYMSLHFPFGLWLLDIQVTCHPSISAFRNLFLGLVGGQKKFRIELGLHVESNFLNSGFPSCLVLSLSGYLLSLTPKSITFSSCLDDRWMTKSLVHTWNCCSNKILDIGYRLVLCDLSCDECSKYTTVCPSSNR